jgi:hypothetical protein
VNTLKDSLKILTLNYKLFEHNFEKEEHVFYVNSCNKVYNSDVLQSAYIFGYYESKQIFMRNYVPKATADQRNVDLIKITIMDNDINNLIKYTNLVLYVSREPLYDIKVGNNDSTLLKISSLDKETHLYNGDLLVANVLGEKIVWIYCKNNININIKDNLTSSLSPLSPLSPSSEIFNEVENLCKKFKCYELQDEIESLFKKLENVDSSLITDILTHKINYLDALRTTTSNDKKSFILNKCKTNDLYKIPPFCALEYHINKTNKFNVNNSDQILEQLINIEKNIYYWTDISKHDINIMFTECLSEEKYKNKKRKYEYLIESEYYY